MDTITEQFVFEKETNERLQKFAKRVSKTHESNEKIIRYMVMKDAMDCYEFDALKLTPKQYIEQSIQNTNQWLNLDRKQIKPNELFYYGLSYLFFVSLEKKES